MMASAGNGASCSEPLEQTVPVLNVLPHTLFTSTQSLVLASTSQPPPPPPTPPAHNGPIESLHLSSITCLEPNPSLYPLFSFFPFVFFLTPIFTSDVPLTPSHTISIKGKLSRSWQVFSLRVCVCACVCTETDSQREGQPGACRETHERSDWKGSNTNR